MLRLRNGGLGGEAEAEAGADSGGGMGTLHGGRGTTRSGSTTTFYPRQREMPTTL